MTTRFPLNKGQYALIDDEHLTLVQSTKWHVTKDGYAARMKPHTKTEKRTTQMMHRFLYESIVGSIPEKMQIDHIDGNRLNNQIGNLRAVSNRENAQNKQVQREGKTRSGVIGVRPSYKGSKRWIALIYIDGRERSLGTFDDRHEAHQVYMDACAKLEQK